MYNTIRGCMAITKKYNSNILNCSIQYKIVDSISTYLKTTYNTCDILVMRSYSTEDNDSVKVSSYYNQKNKETLQKLLEDPKKLMLYNKLKLELERLRQTDMRVPSQLTDIDWITLLLSDTKAQRRKRLIYRWKTEKSEEGDIKKKQISIETLKKKRIESRNEDNALTYVLNHNAMFIRISQAMMNNFYNKRLLNAMMFNEPKIVFDLSYDNHMTPNEALNCGKQLLLSFSVNRAHPDPFDLYFCNVNKNSFTMQQFHKGLPTLYDDSFPLTVTEKSYLDIFDPRDIVYLTPDAHYSLKEFNPNLVYIIGGLVDKHSQNELTLEVAKKARLRMYRFPLSEYSDWGSGSAKSLPLNQVMSILLDLRHTKSWTEALKNVPKRKLKTSRLYSMAKKIDYRRKQLNLLKRSDNDNKND